MAKMERLMASQRGLVDLEEFQFGPQGRKVPLFHSWNAKDFGEASLPPPYRQLRWMNNPPEGRIEPLSRRLSAKSDVRRRGRGF